MVKTIPTLGREMGRRSNCLQQGGLPTDIAAAVAFLSQQASQGATGQTLRMCGGNMVGR